MILGKLWHAFKARMNKPVNFVGEAREVEG